MQDGVKSKVEKWTSEDALGCTDGVHNPALTDTQALGPILSTSLLLVRQKS